MTIYDNFNKNNDPVKMHDHVFLNGMQSLHVQQKDMLKKVSNTNEKRITHDKYLNILLVHY